MRIVYLKQYKHCLTHKLTIFIVVVVPLPYLPSSFASPQMGMMGNVGPYGGPYGQSAGQGLGGAGLAPQLQNKAGLPNSLAQFSLDKKPQPMQGMAGMVSNQPTNLQISSLAHTYVYTRAVSQLLQHEGFLILLLHIFVK